MVIEIREFYLGEIFVFDTLEMIFSRQDNTEENELKIENRLKALDWKWDFDNVVAFLIVITCLCIYTYSEVYDWFRDAYPEIVCRDERYDTLLRFNFYMIGTSSEIVKFKIIEISSYWVFETICDFAIKFNII